MYNYYVLIMSDIYSQVWLNENKYIDRFKKNKIDLSKGELISKCPFGVKTSSKKQNFSALTSKKRSNKRNKCTLSN